MTSYRWTIVSLLLFSTTVNYRNRIVKPEEANLKGWFDAGVTCVGMGSNLFPADMIKNSDWAGITKLCSDALAIVKNIRK